MPKEIRFPEEPSRSRSRNFKNVTVWNNSLLKHINGYVNKLSKGTKEYFIYIFPETHHKFIIPVSKGILRWTHRFKFSELDLKQYHLCNNTLYSKSCTQTFFFFFLTHQAGFISLHPVSTWSNLWCQNIM